MLKLTGVCFIAVISQAVALYPGEKSTPVTQLPGWKGDLPSKWTTGFTYAGTPPNGQGEMYSHWVFVESERDPANDPVVVWYQGGPGASSLYGLLVEFGPLLLNEQSYEHPDYNKTGIPQMVRNAYSWSKTANVLVVDNPPPVGFSYCTPAGPSGTGTSCGAWNDELAAKAQHTVLTRWVEQMASFKTNKMFITGESYAGVYVPTIVRALLEDPQQVNLQGFAVGDGCMGTEVLCGGGSGPFWDIEFLHGHGQFSNRLYREIQASCTELELQLGNLSSTCKQATSKVSGEVGSYYAYNLYDTCYGRNVFRPRQYWSSNPLGGAENDYPCAGSAQRVWLNRSDVRSALHLDSDAYYFSGDNGAGFNYSLTEKDLLPFYKQVIEDNKLKVLVYNGDTDPGINSFITQDKYTGYFDEAGLKLTQTWRPWTLDGKNDMGGYVFSYGENFRFATIRGSGHMVPEFKPQAASVLIQSFLEDQALPSLNN